MTKLKYVGPFDEVEVPDGYVVRRVKNGEAVEFFDAATVGEAPSGDDLGSGLLAQTENWQRVDATNKKGSDK